MSVLPGATLLVLISIEVLGLGSLAAAAASAAVVDEEHDDGIGSISLRSEKLSRFFVEVVIAEDDDGVGDMIVNEELPIKDAPIVIVDEQSVMQPTVII